MFTLKKFCFCYKLKTGGYVIGWCEIFLSLLIGFGLIAVIAFALSDFFKLLSYVNEDYDKAKFPVTSNENY